MIYNTQLPLRYTNDCYKTNPAQLFTVMEPVETATNSVWCNLTNCLLEIIMTTTFSLAYADSSEFFQLKNSFDENSFHVPGHMHILCTASWERQQHWHYLLVSKALCWTCHTSNACIADFMFTMFTFWFVSYWLASYSMQA